MKKILVGFVVVLLIAGLAVVAFVIFNQNKEPVDYMLENQSNTTLPDYNNTSSCANKLVDLPYCEGTMLKQVLNNSDCLQTVLIHNTCQFGCLNGSCREPPAGKCEPGLIGNTYCENNVVKRLYQNQDCSVTATVGLGCRYGNCNNGVCPEKPIEQSSCIRNCISWAGTEWSVEGYMPTINGQEAIGKLSCLGNCTMTGSLTGVFNRTNFHRFSLFYAGNFSMLAYPTNVLGGTFRVAILGHNFPSESVYFNQGTTFRSFGLVKILDINEYDTINNRFRAYFNRVGFTESSFLFGYDDQPTFTVKFLYEVNGINPELKYNIILNDSIRLNNLS